MDKDGTESMKDLEGITVVALEQAVAAPYASSRLAEAGARVIKIERPDAAQAAEDERQKSETQWLELEMLREELEA